jgi:hypothetical protein
MEPTTIFQVNENGDQIILDHNEEINKILEERKNEYILVSKSKLDFKEEENLF